jgi:hypothetical protein
LWSNIFEFCYSTVSKGNGLLVKTRCCAVGADPLDHGELHVDAAEDDVGPGLAVEGGLTLVVADNDGLDSAELGQLPLDVLEPGLTGPKRAAAVLDIINELLTVNLVILTPW